MLESLRMTVPTWMHAILDLDRTAWLLIGSMQLALVALMAGLFIRLVNRSAIWSHRMWLATLLLTLGCLPVHWLSWGWMPVSLSTNEPHYANPSSATQLNLAATSQPPSIANELTVKTTSPQASQAESQSALHPTHDSADRELSAPNEVEVPHGVVASQVSYISSFKLSPFDVVVSLYVLVVTWLLVWMLFGMRKLILLWRAGRPLLTSSDAIFFAVADRLKLQHRFQVRAVAHLPMPLVFGVLKCRVLVPDDFEEWSLEEQESVAFHELTHVKRRDTLIEVVSQFVCAVYWFHPASWLVRRKLRQSREWATDETVLRYGLSSSSYARSIVAILSRLSAEPHSLVTTPAVAMSLYGDVEQRLQNIFVSTSTARCRGRGWSLMAVLCLIAGATCFRLVAAEPQAVAQDSPSAATNDTTSQAQTIAKAPSSNDLWATIEENENDLLSRIRDCDVLTVEGDDYHSLLTVEGQVRTDNGEPVEGAIVLLRESSTWRISSEPTKYIDVANRHLVRTQDVFARTVTDRDGNYRFEKAKAPAINFGNPWRGDIVAGHPKLGVGWLNLPSKPERVRVDPGMTVVLAPVTNIVGRYVSPNDEPLSQAVMNVYTLHLDQREPPFNAEFDLQASQITPRDTTASDGGFRIKGLPVNLIASVGGPNQSPWLNGHEFVATSRQVSPGPYVFNMLEGTETTITHSPCVIVANKGVRVSISTVDAENKPVEGIPVSLSAGVDAIKTDVNGRAQLNIHPGAVKQAARDQLRLFLNCPEESDFLRQYAVSSIADIEAGKTLDVTLRKCARVTGTVVDDTGKPVNNLMVSQAGDSMDVLARGMTNTDGRYSIKLAPGKHTLLFATDTPGFDLPSTSEFYRGNRKPFTDYPHMAVDVADGQPKDVGTFAVVRVPAIEAKVWLPDGQAAVGADVVIMDSDMNQVPLTIPRPIPSLRLELSKHTLTNELGNVQLLTKGRPTRRATILAKYMDGTECLTGEVTIPETPDARLEVRLKPAMKIEGQVLKDGKPLAGAKVRIEGFTSVGRGGRVGTYGRTTVTDSDGWYRTTGEADLDYRAKLESVPGLQQPPNESASIESSTPELLRFQTISLTTYHEEVMGAVLNKSRQPIAGAKVRVMGQAQNWFDHLANSQLTTDAQGRFHLKNMPSGEYHLDVMVPMAAEQWRSAAFKIRAGDKQCEIIFDRP